MSRVIVKQLPKKISEENLRNLFGSKGVITDLQLKYTSDGKFRQFAFIGYKTDAEAKEAIRYFNNSCIKTSRIKVELCATLGSGDKPQSWSKYSKDSKVNLKKIIKEKEPIEEVVEKQKKKSKKNITKIDEIIAEHKDDPQFKEFMKAHDKNRALWSNDAAMENNKDDREGTDNEDAAESGDADDVKDDVEKVKKERQVIADDNDEADNISEASTTKEKIAEKPISDLEYMKSLMSNSTKKAKVVKPSRVKKESIDLFTIKIHNTPYKIKRKDVLQFFYPIKPYSIRLPIKVHGFCYVGFKSEADMTKAMTKHKSFIKGKQVFFSDFTEKNKIKKSQLTEEEQAGTVNSSKMTQNPKWAQQKDNLHSEEDIGESGKIFFRNLSYTVTENDLREVFEKYGPVAEIHLPVDATTRQIKGFGTVTFMMPEHAVVAFNELDGSDFHGRLFHLITCKSFDKSNEEENEAGLSFKQKKELKQKKTAQQSTNWNTLFLGTNAIAEIIAKKFDTTKEKVLDTSEGGSKAAVRMALGETEIIIEMKKFLEENGVLLDAFNEVSSKRSKTIILAKNLPAETTVAELTPLFSKFGPIGRFILPPSGVTALIEFCEPSEARQAFQKLAYSKFKHLPLYLEWAPENTFKTSFDGKPLIPKIEVDSPVIKETNLITSPKKETNDTAIKKKPNEDDNKTDDEDNGDGDGDDDDEDDDEPPEPNTTIFLRNLNFKTEKKAVQEHFKHLGGIHIVEIAKRRDPDNPQHFNSLGYGFIQFKKAAIADKALKQMQMTLIEGNTVELKRSDRILKPVNTVQRKKVSKTKQTGSKILVRNIPFQANYNEIRDIFKAFGELRSVRLPKKAVPGETSHRGFGFVDYNNKSDAGKAFKALSQSTHLYGRRLVLEWASVDTEDLDELRKRTAKQFQSSESPAKRSKKAVYDMSALSSKKKSKKSNDDDDDNDDYDGNGSDEEVMKDNHFDYGDDDDFGADGGYEEDKEAFL